PKNKSSKEAIESQIKESSGESNYRYDLAYVKTVQEYYKEPEEFSAVLRSGTEELKDSYSKSMELYMNKKYKNALNMLSGIDLQSNSQARYLKRHIYSHLERYDQAENTFKILT